jgi:hypothetical protein
MPCDLVRQRSLKFYEYYFESSYPHFILESAQLFLYSATLAYEL